MVKQARGRAGPRRRLPWPEAAALAAVLLLVAGSWLLVRGTATGVYRSFARFGDPPLLAIRVPGPDPAAAAAPTPDAAVSQLGHYGYFWSERAFHYRTALMFAVDGAGDPALLHHDTAQQHPGGVDAWREYTLLMEPVYGFLYRLAGDQSRPFVEFLLSLVPLLHALLLLPVYAAARALGAARPAAVAAALVTAGCHLGFARLAGSLLLKEDFSLLLLLGFTALHLWAWRRDDRALLGTAGLVLVAVLASWHLAQFLAAALLGTAAVAHLAGATPSPDDGPGRRHPAWLMPAVYAAAFAAAGLTPSLRERWFLLSPPMAVPAAWLAAVLLAPRLGPVGRRASGRIGLLLALTAAALAAAFLNPVHGGDYGHVSGLLLAKLQHALAVPADPTVLTFAVRQFWTPPFHTPHLPEILAGLGFAAPLLALAVAWSLAAAVRPSTAPARRGFALLVPVLAAAWILAARLGVVFLPFGAIAAALMLQEAAGRLSARADRRGWVAAIVLAAAVAANLPGNLAAPLAMARGVLAGRPVPVQASDDLKTELRTELLRWLTRSTPGPGSVLPGRPAAVLADIGLSTQVLLYTGRPVVLNSQFENVGIRTRTERWLDALFGTDPALLHAFARAHDARYLVLDRDWALADGVGSARWMAAVPAPLTLERTVVRLHLDPLGVPGFAPLWDNERYRVFAVLDPGESVDPAAWDTRFASWWQRGNVTVADGGLVDLAGDRERLLACEREALRLQQEQSRILAGAAARRPGWPDLLSLQRQVALARLAECTGADTAAAEAASFARLVNAVQAVLADVDPQAGVPVGQALERLLDGPGGWVDQQARTGTGPAAQAVAAQLAAMAGRYDEAAARFAAAADRWDEMGPPRGPAPALRRQLWDEALLWLVAAGRCDEARQRAAQWGPHAGGGDGGPGTVVRRLAAAAPTSR